MLDTKLIGVEIAARAVVDAFVDMDEGDELTAEHCEVLLGLVDALGDYDESRDNQMRVYLCPDDDRGNVAMFKGLTIERAALRYVHETFGQKEKDDGVLLLWGLEEGEEPDHPLFVQYRYGMYGERKLVVDNLRGGR